MAISVERPSSPLRWKSWRWQRLSPCSSKLWWWNQCRRWHLLSSDLALDAQILVFRAGPRSFQSRPLGFTSHSLTGALRQSEEVGLRGGGSTSGQKSSDFQRLMHELSASCRLVTLTHQPICLKPWLGRLLLHFLLSFGPASPQLRHPKLWFHNYTKIQIH